jgi:hypothetical protein
MTHNPIMCDDGQFRELDELLLLQEKADRCPEETKLDIRQGSNFLKKYRA